MSIRPSAVSMQINDVFSSFHNFCVTLYLFTHSDIKTILIPVTTFATLARSTVQVSRFVITVFWVWLHLLQFCVSNQIICPEEDALNKPWRPLPSGRMALTNARFLRWILLPICLIISFYLNVWEAGLALALGIWVHNEQRFHAHWLTRNICNAIGYAAFDRGATFVGCSGTQCIPRPSVFLAQTTTAMIILTTIHAQDFRDVEGDMKFNRRTIPIVMPTGGRITMPLLLCSWSLLLIRGWAPSAATATPLLLTGVLTGVRFAWFKSPKEDKISYIFYNLWLCLAQVILLKAKF